MNLGRVGATTQRVLIQLRHDPRTLGLLFIIPCVLLALLKYVFNGLEAQFNYIAPLILGIFPLLMMFLVTSIATLRERTSGTLDRLLTMPIGKLDIMVGYGLAFSLVGLVQSLLVSWVTLGLLGVKVAGGVLPVVVAAVVAAFLGTCLGLLVSAFAQTEFQAVELVMPSIMPQVLLCGLFVARDQMAKPLQWIADALPLTYSVDAMRLAATGPAWSGTYLRDITVVAVVGLGSLGLAAITIRRQR
jgi:ABC-2 type transport system permease protein